VSIEHLDRPTVAAVRPPAPEWGSDVAAEMLRLLGVEYAALNPGASFRGLHDSLVNYNGNERPGMILCNHEEVAVAIAHGYAKLSERPMAAIVHSNVGLLHATMAIFNAWADRLPVLVLGATGPMDATQRRPWIDWLHTSYAQGEVVRNFTKWEHQPASVEAIPEAMLRAWHAAIAEPSGPVYVCFDAGLQEQRLDPSRPVSIPDVTRYPLPTPIQPSAEAIERAARWLTAAEFPVVLLGRGGRSEQSWRELVALAEALGAAVLSDSKSPAGFPTSHPLHQAGVAMRGGQEFAEVLRQADVVLALERIDPAGTLRMALQEGAGQARSGHQEVSWPRLINVSLDSLALRSWSADFQELPPAELPIIASVGPTITALLDRVERGLADDPAARRRAEARTRVHQARRQRMDAAWADRRIQSWEPASGSLMSLTRAIAELRTALGDRYQQAIMARIPLTWTNGVWEFDQPGSFLGGDGGAGIGSGPGMTVGAALAARGSGRTVIGVLGDGDLLMANSALWTAAHHEIPLLIVVANNRSYFNDEEHQERMARVRSRPVENRWVGQRLDEPPVDFAGLARTLGVEGFGPVSDPTELPKTYGAALAAIDEGRPALVDVRISPR
jgi:thiamine pyrophosphate-dependent acetolactate synthase large subunit-like protein